MAKPRIFISSTFYDLKQVRADIDRFVKEIGYEPVRNEAGSIPYGKEDKLEEYCYKEISDIEILVGVIGGNYGSASQHEPYSISQIEIKTALEQKKQVYLFIDKNVFSEYQTYLINKTNKTIKYKFVNNIKIYEFIQEIELLPKNNVITAFETAQDIVSFLREQWAGLFRDLIVKDSQQHQFGNLSTKVNELTEVSATLKRYLEEVLESNLGRPKVKQVIKEENIRLAEKKLINDLASVPYLRHLFNGHKIKPEEIYKIIRDSNTFAEFKGKVIDKSSTEGIKFCIKDKDAFDDINEGRILIGKPEYVFNPKDIELTAEEKEIQTLKIPSRLAKKNDAQAKAIAASRSKKPTKKIVKKAIKKSPIPRKSI